MAPLPLVPLVSTPCHCETIHWQFAWTPAKVILTVPLPGEGLSARKTLSRLCGVPTPSKATVATRAQPAIPPPVTVGAGEAAVVLCPITATVTSALAAGAMLTVVQVFRSARLLPAVSRCWLMPVATAAGCRCTLARPASRGDVGCSTQVAIAAISATAAILSVRRGREGEANIPGYTTDAKMATSVRTGKRGGSATPVRYRTVRALSPMPAWRERGPAPPLEQYPPGGTLDREPRARAAPGA